MLSAGWVQTDYVISEEGIRIWETFQEDLDTSNCAGVSRIETTVLCLAAYLEVDDPMPGEPEGSGSEHTFIPWEM